MLRILRDGRGTVNLASRIFEICRVQKLTAKVALVTTGIHVATERAFTLNEAIRKKGIVLLTI
jgi:hypothetical protein